MGGELMVVWFFVILMNLPSFGGSVAIEVETLTKQGCIDLQRAANSPDSPLSGFKHEMTECNFRVLDN